VIAPWKSRALSILILTRNSVSGNEAALLIHQCFIADGVLEELPTPSSVGKTEVGGIDLNKARMRWVVEAIDVSKRMAIEAIFEITAA
jgi:hypothetical protein